MTTPDDAPPDVDPEQTRAALDHLGAQLDAVALRLEELDAAAAAAAAAVAADRATEPRGA
jgi:hypothetical protein